MVVISDADIGLAISKHQARHTSLARPAQAHIAKFSLPYKIIFSNFGLLQYALYVYVITLETFKFNGFK